VIVLVVAHDIDHVGEGLAASLKEAAELGHVTSHTDVAAEDQDLGVVCVGKIDVPEL
jgi:sorbitol-specific phosphotransferase system component IIA